MWLPWPKTRYCLCVFATAAPSFDDIDTAARQHWPLASVSAFPVVTEVVFDSPPLPPAAAGADAPPAVKLSGPYQRRPTAQDLTNQKIALQAIVTFLATQWAVRP